MKIKSILLISILLVMCFSFAAYATQNSDIKIGMTFAHVAIDNYQTTAYNEAIKYAKEIGINAVVLDALMDSNTQNNQIENLISKKVDVIVVWPVNGTAIVPAVKKAYKAGIPVITTDSPIVKSGAKYVTSHVATDNYKMGVSAAEMMIEGLGGKGGKVVEIAGTPGYVTSIDRTRGIKDTLTKSDVELLETQPGDWSREKAQSITENLLTKYGKFDGVIAHNDNMLIGALNALRQMGKDKGVILTSAAWYGEGYDLIKAGVIYGSCIQDPAKLMRLVIDTAVKVAKGEEVEQFTYMPTPKVTQENISEFERPSF